MNSIELDLSRYEELIRKEERLAQLIKLAKVEGNFVTVSAILRICDAEVKE